MKTVVLNLVCLQIAILLANGASDTHGPVRQVNLIPELDPRMLHGTIEAIDPDDLRVMIKTDYGRVLFLTVPDCAVISRLREGDRVRLDVDAQGSIKHLRTIAPVLKSGLNTGDRPAWASGPCAEIGA